METALARSRSTQRAPLSALTKLTMAALTGFALAIVYASTILIDQWGVDTAIMIAVILIIAGSNLIRWRWTPLLGAILPIVILAPSLPLVINDLMHPEAFDFFAFMVIFVALALVVVVAGAGATIQNYRSRDRRMPRIMLPALASLAALCLGAILVGAIPREVGAAVSPDILAGLPPITTPGFKFAQTQLTAKAGETVALRLENTHNAPHSFDVDALNVHVSAAPGTQRLILFTPATPGTYTFYCAIPGHRDLGMEGTLLVEP